MKYLLLAALSFELFLGATASYGAGIKELMDRKPAKIEGGRTGNLRQRALKRLAKAQKLMASEKYQDSLKVLDGLEKSLKSNKYGLSQVYQTKGYVYAQSDRFPQAAESFQKTLDLKALPKAPLLNTMYSLAQVLVAQEKFIEAIPLLQDYMFNKEPARPDVFFFYGQILAQLKEIPAATRNIEKAVSLSSSPKESWLRLLVALYYEQKQYSKAAVILDKLVKIRPDKTKYWKQLSSVYLAMDKESKALAVLEVAYKNDALKEEKDLLQLVRLSLFEGVPFKAGKYLDKAISEGKVEKTAKHFELLAESWVQAQEIDLALVALKKAAPLSKNGKLYVRQGQLFLEKEKWKDSISSLKKGIAKGGLKKPGLAHVALGIAHYNAGSKKLALSSFGKAAKFPKFAKQAKEWMNHVSTE